MSSNCQRLEFVSCLCFRYFFKNILSPMTGNWTCKYFIFYYFSMKIILKQNVISFDHSVIFNFYRLCIIDIFLYFVALGTNQKNCVCSLLTFMRVWRDKYQNVIIPKNHRFTKCKTCSHLKAVLKGKPEVFDSDVFDKKKLNILQEK